MTRHQDIDPATPRLTEQRARSLIWILIGLLVGVVVVSVLGGVVVISQIRTTQVDRLPQAEKNDETLAIVKDCTQTGGRCYQRGQRQTAAILNSAQRIIIISAACSVDVAPAQPVTDRVQQITDCVTQRLATPAAP